jgi:hypothetical protein
MASIQGFRGVKRNSEIDDDRRGGRGDDDVRPEDGAREDLVHNPLVAGTRDGLDYFREHQIVPVANSWEIGATVAVDVRGSLGINLAPPALGVGSRATRIPEEWEEWKKAKAALVD